MKEQLKKVLLLGSGALRIGQAGEFDYSGSQALLLVRMQIGAAAMETVWRFLKKLKIELP